MESAPSEILTVITQAVEIPGAPVWTAGELEFSDITSNGVSMSWPEATADDGVDGYRVYLKGRNEPVVTVTNDVYSHTASGLEPDTRYHFTVKAYNARERAPDFISRLQHRRSSRQERVNRINHIGTAKAGRNTGRHIAGAVSS